MLNGQLKLTTLWSFSNRLKSLLVIIWLLASGISSYAQTMENLARPHEGRSRRETSTHKINEKGEFDPNGKPDPSSNSDNKSVKPGDTRVLMDAKGPGAITHMWMTFLGPEPHPWAKMVLPPIRRCYYAFTGMVQTGREWKRRSVIFSPTRSASAVR